MSNLITNEKAGKDQYLKMSNGATSVLITVLLLAGSDFAQTKWEKELVVWLAEKDQMIFGGGTVGFDLDDIAWSTEDFDEQRDFLCAVIDKALERHRWNCLDYDPPFVTDSLQEFRRLVEKYKVEYIQSEKQWDEEPYELTKCPVHAVYVHANGCHICNDG